MKRVLLILCWLGLALIGQAQNDAVITFHKGRTQVGVNEDGRLQINVPPKEMRKFKETGWVQYSDFGAKGDGKTDDIDAIAATHAFANAQKLPVRANDDATYYIGGKPRTAIIKTDTYFGKAAFIIDDTNVERIGAAVFMVSSEKLPFEPEGVSSLRKNQ